MKHTVVVGAFLLMAVGGNATAACEDSGYTKQVKATGANSIENTLSGKRILATGDDGEWNEDHCANGALYKVGVSPDDPVDPRAYRGTWEVSDSGEDSEVTYHYTVGGNSSFSWKLWQDKSGNLCWEDGGSIIATAPAPGPLSGTCEIP